MTSFHQTRRISAMRGSLERSAALATSTLKARIAVLRWVVGGVQGGAIGAACYALAWLTWMVRDRGIGGSGSKELGYTRRRALISEGRAGRGSFRCRSSVGAKKGFAARGFKSSVDRQPTTRIAKVNRNSKTEYIFTCKDSWHSNCFSGVVLYERDCNLLLFSICTLQFATLL